MSRYSRRLFSCLSMGTFLLSVISTVYVMAQPANDNSDQSGGGKSLLLSEPKTPEELFDSTVLMTKLGRPNLAKQYLQQFMNGNPDDDFLLKLHDDYGPAPFLQLERTDALKSLATRLVDQLNKALEKRAKDPTRINKLIDGLSGDLEDREVSMLMLRKLGPSSIPGLIRRLASPKDNKERDRIAYSLVRLGKGNLPAIMGALDSSNNTLRASALDIAGYLGSQETIPHLWAPAFSEQELPAVKAAARRALSRILNDHPERVGQIPQEGVAEELRRISMRYFEGKHKWDLNEQGKVELWTWSKELETVEKVELDPDAATHFEGSRFARSALEMSPQHPETQAAYVGMSLASASYEAGWDQPLPHGPGTAHDLAASSGSELLSRSLALALEHNNSSTAVATLRLLGSVSTRHQLFNTTAEHSPILSALNHSDPQVQFAAASAIMQLDPDKPFPGSGRVIQIFSRALSNESGARAVMIHPNRDTAGTYGRFVSEMGYQPLTATTGRNGFQLAIQRSDVELIVISVNTVQWELAQTLANFRADARTKWIPIVLLGGDYARDRLERTIKRSQPCTYVVETVTGDAFKDQLRPWLSAGQSRPLTEEQRAIQEEEAAYWLAHIASGQRTSIFRFEASSESDLQCIRERTSRRKCHYHTGSSSHSTSPV